MNNHKKHLAWEATSWLFIIVTTLFTALFFPWYIAQTVLNVVIALAVVSALFWYFRSRRLYFETHSKHAEISAKHLELLSHKKILNLIYEKSPDGFLILDEEHRIESFSPALEKMTGYRASDIIGLLAERILKFRAVNDNTLLPHLMLLKTNATKAQRVTNFITTKSGKEIEIEADYICIDEDGELKGLATIREKN